LLALAGCASVQPISDTDRKAVVAVAIAPQVAKPPAMYYLGPGGAAGLMFGAIGGAMAAGSIEESRKSFQQFVDRNGISIEGIVLDEVSAAVKRSRKFPLVDAPQPGAATLLVSIYQYGFSIPNGFSSKLVPILALRCELKDAAGKLVWSADDRLLTLGNPVEPSEPDAIRNDPRAMEASWRAAARHLAAAIVARY
jgi:hypothetical protein